MSAPAKGQELTVGTDIGGIYAGDNNPAKLSHPTLSIASGTVIELDMSAHMKGTYTAANFASVDQGDVGHWRAADRRGSLMPCQLIVNRRKLGFSSSTCADAPSQR